MPAEGAGNFLTQRLGPLPVWAWAAIAIVLLGAYAWWRKIGPFAEGGGIPFGGSDVSLGGLLGAGSSTDMGTLADGGPPPPTGATQSQGRTLNAYGVPSGLWKTLTEHQKELLKAHPELTYR